MPRAQELYFTDDDLGAIGATIWWTFSPIDRDSLTQSLRERHLDEIFKLPRISSDVALRRMMDHVKDVYVRPQGNQRFIVRPLRGERGAYALYLERPDPEVRHRNVYIKYMHAKVVADSLSITWDAAPAQPDAGAYMNQQLTKAQSTLMADDLSQWLKGILVSRLDATLLRDAGGVWFVPKAKIAGLKTLEEIFMPRLTLVRAGRTESFVQNVLTSMREEALKAMEEINAWYEANTEFNDRNARTRRAHESLLSDLRNKVDRYEKLVQRPMLDIHSSLLDLKNKIAGTFFRANAAAQGRAVEQGQRLLEIDDDKHVEPTPEEAAVELANDPAYQRFAVLETDDDKPAEGEGEGDDGTGRKLEID
jgi:hypothetical protein